MFKCETVMRMLHHFEHVVVYLHRLKDKEMPGATKNILILIINSCTWSKCTV